ncbi:oligosaccharide flippase family protein [Marivita sp. GX14005]|uniref:oligosaccharide flippase family protein n=1 Tax=Marivita sp. GX14005 TaxID=2942276 RepID=UPI00201912B6|nr:oligosaccharide flippase family protein [Marivita sp. GX14005]MCL3881765.1 oligosaccharide flippase family protein [Marivita sp. GX14005]
MNGFAGRLRGGSLQARFMRGSLFTLGGYGASQGLRLLSNLVLTRLLFPEAFGLMALVAIIMQGLAMFSDVGISPAIMQSKRGDDPEFLDTAWTIQVIRGAVLWVFASLIAVPVASIYNEPLLAWILPVSGLSLLVSGFNPTRMETANRHLLLGRLTGIDLAAQAAGIVLAVGLAWWMQSVWALVISGVAASVLQLAAYDLYLPGKRNRFHWESGAAAELIHFGKWIFLSTICGFIYMQSDKLLLGKYLPLDQFGVYNIGFFLASFPLLMGGVMTRKMLIPLYRERPPADSDANFRKLQRMRFVLTAGIVALTGAVALSGVWLVDTLYDDRYAMAGAVVVLLASMQMPQIIALTYEQAALATGDSRRFFVLSAARAVLTVSFLLAGLALGGLFGALIGMGLAGLAAYPFVVWLARHAGAWDPAHDGAYALVAAALVALAIWFNSNQISVLAAL